MESKGFGRKDVTAMTNERSMRQQDDVGKEFVRKSATEQHPAENVDETSGGAVNNAQPIRGGLTAESTSEGRMETAPTGIGGRRQDERAMYVLGRRGKSRLETPVFQAGDGDDGEAVAVFTERGLASSYLESADWTETHEPAALLPKELGQWLNEARAEGVRMLIVNPDRHAHLEGTPQRVIYLSDREQSSEQLYRELIAMESS